MIDSTITIPIQKIIYLSSAYNLTKKTIAVQWLLGNILLVAIVLTSIGLYFLMKYIKPVSIDDKKEKQPIKTFSLLYLSIVFIIGVILTNFFLDTWFLLLWCFLYGIVLFLIFKWHSLFIRYNHSMPAGWLIIYIAVIVVSFFIYNIFPTMVTAHEAQTESKTYTAHR